MDTIPDEKRVKLAVALEDPANSADLPGLNRLLSEEFRQQFIYVGTVPAGRSLFDEGE
ncbi:MAG: hypothetical protein R3E12_00295 [Candidatus Eisenbacteria bacterium]